MILHRNISKSPRAMPTYVNGKRYRSIRQACIAYNVSESSVYNFMKTNNLTVEKAILCASQPRKNSPHPITIDGITYPSIRAAARELKLSSTSLWKRLQKS